MKMSTTVQDTNVSVTIDDAALARFLSQAFTSNGITTGAQWQSLLTNAVFSAANNPGLGSQARQLLISFFASIVKVS